MSEQAKINLYYLFIKQPPKVKYAWFRKAFREGKREVLHLLTVWSSQEGQEQQETINRAWEVFGE